MVSSDDRLTERGANPRTGLVSPFVTSDSDASHGPDYLTASRPFAKARTRSGKWKQDGLGWSLVESPRLSPIAQSTDAPPTRQVSVKDLEDKLLLEMPSLQNPEPVNLTHEQVKQYQKEMARIRREEGSDAIVDPETLPIPRVPTPEGPSTPPKRLHKIVQRKKVGSGRVARNGSTETVVISKEKRASSVPTPRKPIREPPRVRIMTPNNTPRSLSSVTGVQFKDPFLGQRHEPYLIQTKEDAQNQNSLISPQEVAVLPPLNQMQSAPTIRLPQSKPQEVAHRQSSFQRPITSKGGCFVRPAIPTLNQCLPKIQFQHPSEFANLESLSCRRLNQALPARLRPLDQQRKLVEDACTSINTFTTISGQANSKSPRPRTQRQNGSNLVPRAMQLCPKDDAAKENHIRIPAGTPILKHRSSTSSMVRSHELTKEGQQEQQPLTSVKPASLATMTEPQELTTGSAKSTEECCRASMKRMQRLDAQSAAKPVWNPRSPTKNQKSRLGSVNIARDVTQKDRGGGVGITHTYGHPGDRPAEPTVRNDASTWFAGHWAETHEGPVLPNKMNARLWSEVVEEQLQLPVSLKCVQGIVYRMLCSLLRTLLDSPTALQILRSQDAMAREYLIAVKDALLAGVCLLVLFISLLLIRKFVAVTASVLYWILHPCNLALAVLRWCIMD